MEERFVPLGASEGRPIETHEPSAGADPRQPLDDPRALQILSTEHWSLLTARSLVYNEAFARGGMFMAFLSATLVVLGLISTATGFSDPFLVVVAGVLAVDLRRPRDIGSHRGSQQRGPSLPPGHEPPPPRLPRDGPGPRALFHQQPPR